MYIVCMAYILKKRLKGRTYYYLAESQRINGSPRIVWQKYLGTADKIKEKLLESKKEYLEDISTFEIGSLAAIESVEREINFLKIIDEIVPKRDQGMSVGLYLYLIVLNRAIEPKSKASLGEWLKKTAINEYRGVDFSLLDSANFWDHMDKVSSEQIEAISDVVARRVIEKYEISLDCLLYDTTNYFTQMSAETESELSRYTHSKAGKHQLRHVGLALLCNRQEGVPLFHRLYSANMHDSKLFSQIQRQLFQLLLSLKKGKERMTLVFDKGCNSPENLSEVDKSDFFFVGTLSTYHYPKLCSVPLSDYKEVDYEGKPLYAYRTTMEVYGKERAVVVSFNPRTYKKKIHWMSRTILRTKRKLQELRQDLKSADKRTTVQSVERKVAEILAESHIGPVFDVKVSSYYGKYRMSIRTVPLVIKEYRARFGKNIIFTDHLDWSDEEIILAYRDRHKIETSFRWTKDPFLVRWTPMYHWTDSKIRVHGFSCVMALLFLSLLHKKMKEAKLSMSLDRAMESLRDIRLAYCYYPRKAQPVRKICRLSNTEKELLTALNLELPVIR
jgi:transposase